MAANPSFTEPSGARPVILGTGLTGLAISHALSAAGITHLLIGDRPTDVPRLGESLNAEGSLEIARQFPDLARFFFHKQQQALLFGDHTVSFDSLPLVAGPGYQTLLGYPPTVQLLHVDRVGFDRALFEKVVADEHCLFVEDRATALEGCAPADRIDRVVLASGKTVAATYVFDATNHIRFVARQLGVPRQVMGAARRVVFAHYHRGAEAERTAAQSSSWPHLAQASGLLRQMAERLGACGTLSEDAEAVRASVRPLADAKAVSPPWLRATTLLRLDVGADPVDGLAWCIPLGDYVSVGVSVDPERVTVGSSLLLDGVERAYSSRGLDIRNAFPARSVPLDFRYEHFRHERCYGRNWLLTGPTCCQFWFPSAAGVATGLIAARLAPALLRAPREIAAIYQGYIDRLAAAHSGLDWLVRDDPQSVTEHDLRQRAEAMIDGSVKRLGRYLRLHEPPAELAGGDALARWYESDRRLASPLRIDTAFGETPANRLFASTCESDFQAERPNPVTMLTRADRLDAPEAIVGLVAWLSGQREAGEIGRLATPDVRVLIDRFVLEGIKPLSAWVAFLRASPRVAGLELVPASISGAASQWVLTCQWQGTQAGLPAFSPPFSIRFTLARERVSEIRTQRGDYAFVLGDMPRVAFAAVLGQLMEKAAA